MWSAVTTRVESSSLALPVITERFSVGRSALSDLGADSSIRTSPRSVARRVLRSYDASRPHIRVAPSMIFTFPRKSTISRMR
jgi:hypothetical protein